MSPISGLQTSAWMGNNEAHGPAYPAAALADAAAPSLHQSQLRVLTSAARLILLLQKMVSFFVTWPVQKSVREKQSYFIQHSYICFIKRSHVLHASVTVPFLVVDLPFHL